MPAPSFKDFADIGRAELLTSNLALLDGDIAVMLNDGSAAMADHLAGNVSQRIRATYLDGARGNDLTLWADDRWGLQRHPPVAATGAVSFSRSDIGTPAVTIPAGTIVSTPRASNGAQYQFTTDEPLDFAFHEGGTKTVNATAVDPGPESNVTGGMITVVVSTLGDTFTVFNTFRFAGGNDEENDDDFRARIRVYPATLRRGTLSAIEYGALTIPSVRRAKAEETGAGIISLYVSDINGEFSSAMVTAVQNEIINWRPGGVIVNVTGGAIYPVVIRLSLSVRTGANTQEIASKVESAVMARGMSLRFGDKLDLGMISQAAFNVDPDSIVAVDITEPATSIVPQPYEIIRPTAVVVT
jgi:uncharacterized phage protein gp47/JayE